MRVYRITSEGDTIEWVGTKEAAEQCGEGCTWELVEVPESKQALLAWLNENAVELSGPGLVQVVEATTPSPFVGKSETFEESLRRITVEEEIQNCDLPRLAVLASNVAWRFQELAQKGGAA